jgi:Protein of unknown function (DUF1838)
MNRREALRGMAAIGAAAVGVPTLAAASPVMWPDLSTPEGNMLAYARLVGSLDPSVTRWGWYDGRMMAARPGMAVMDLLGIRGLGASRVIPHPSGTGYMNLRREVGYFYDLATGKVIDRWTNPLINETVDVIHIANDPVNAPIQPVFPRRFYYRDNKREETPEQPFILSWRRAGDTLFTERVTHLWAENPLDPKIWVRESSGPMIQVTEYTQYAVSARDMADRGKQALSYTGSWSRLAPWQPWMLMGQEPGGTMFVAQTGSAERLADLPDGLADLVRERHPRFLEAPTTIEPGMPGLIRYMRDHKPAPLKATAR